MSVICFDILCQFLPLSLFLYTVYVSLQLVLFGEIVVAQKVMYDKFMDDFLVPFISKGFYVAHCPPEMAEQYRQKLQVSLFE